MAVIESRTPEPTPRRSNDGNSQRGLKVTASLRGGCLVAVLVSRRRRVIARRHIRFMDTREPEAVASVWLGSKHGPQFSLGIGPALARKECRCLDMLCFLGPVVLRPGQSPWRDDPSSGRTCRPESRALPARKPTGPRWSRQPHGWFLPDQRTKRTLGWPRVLIR